LRFTDWFCQGGESSNLDSMKPPSFRRPPSVGRSMAFPVSEQNFHATLAREKVKNDEHNPLIADAYADLRRRVSQQGQAQGRWEKERAFFGCMVCVPLSPCSWGTFLGYWPQKNESCRKKEWASMAGVEAFGTSPCPKNSRIWRLLVLPPLAPSWNRVRLASYRRSCGSGNWKRSGLQAGKVSALTAHLSPPRKEFTRSADGRGSKGPLHLDRGSPLTRNGLPGSLRNRVGLGAHSWG